MHAENEVAITSEFVRTHLKAMAEMEVSEQTAQNYALFAALVSAMNMLRPEGYPESTPALNFHPVKE